MKPVKILIVEDEFIISERLAQNLQGTGYEVTNIVVSGKEAIESINADRPDLIIMDIKLEGELDGIDTTKQINKKYTIPVIYLTGYTDKKLFTRAKSTHPVSYLTKPYNSNDINNAIELAIHNAVFFNEKSKGASKKIEDTLFVLSEHIFVKDSKNCFNKVGIEDILWIKGEGSYSVIKTLNEKHVTSHNLKTIENKIQHQGLLRIHRSYIINLSKVNQIIGKRFIIIEYPITNSSKKANDENSERQHKKAIKKIPIGPEYKERIQKYLRLI